MTQCSYDRKWALMINEMSIGSWTLSCGSCTWTIQPLGHRSCQAGLAQAEGGGVCGAPSRHSCTDVARRCCSCSPVGQRCDYGAAGCSFELQVTHQPGEPSVGWQHLFPSGPRCAPSSTDLPGGWGCSLCRHEPRRRVTAPQGPLPSSGSLRL